MLFRSARALALAVLRFAAGTVIPCAVFKAADRSLPVSLKGEIDVTGPAAISDRVTLPSVSGTKPSIGVFAIKSTTGTFPFRIKDNWVTDFDNCFDLAHVINNSQSIPQSLRPTAYKSQCHEVPQGW